MLTRKKALLKFEQYLEQRNLSQVYLVYIKLLFKHLNENKINLFDLTEQQLFSFLAKYSINTKNLYLKALKKYSICFNIRTPLAVALLNKDIKLIRPDVKIREYPNESELSNKVIPKLKEKERIILDFLIATGLRKSELLSLHRSGIDLDRCIAKVDGKGRKQRIVVFPKPVSEEVKALFNREKQEKENAFNYTYGRLRGLCKKITQETKVRMSPHSLRHVFAVSLRRRGLDVVSISHLLGHSNLETTRIYLNETNEQIVANYNAVMKG
jgi:site-specific recombinase XerD